MKLSGPQTERESVGGCVDPSCACVDLPDGEAESDVQFVYKRSKTSNTPLKKKKKNSFDPPVFRTHSPFKTPTKTLYMCQTSSVWWTGPTGTVLVNSGQEKARDGAKAISTAIGAKIQ